MEEKNRTNIGEIFKFGGILTYINLKILAIRYFLLIFATSKRDKEIINLINNKIMEEWKRGEIFEFGGEWYQCVKSPDGSCKHCDMNLGGKCPIPTKECMAILRSDLSYVIFKKLEKVGEPIIYMSRTFQKLKSSDTKRCEYCYFRNQVCNLELCGVESFLVEIKQNKTNMEEKKLNLKPFDLEAAKAGKPVRTRDGRKARIICFDRESVASIVALIMDNNGREEIHSYYEDGKSARTQEYRYDLMMLPEKRKGWINVHQYDVYKTKEEAEAKVSDKANYLTTIEIEYWR